MRSPRTSSTFASTIRRGLRRAFTIGIAAFSIDSAFGWWRRRSMGGFALARLGLGGAIASTHLEWSSLEERWTHQRR